MGGRRRRPWWHLRKADVLFLVGLIGFVSQCIRAYQDVGGDSVIVAGSLVLMGFPVVLRVDDQCNHGDDE